MKRIATLFTAALFSCITLSAQSYADFQKAVAKYKNVSNVTATTTKTTHKAAVSKDEVSTGTLTVKTPDYVSISVNSGKDALLMDKTNFTMTMRGRQAKTNTTKMPSFQTFHDVLESIFSGGKTDISKHSEVTISKSAGNIVLTITPSAASKKAMKRQLFTSFVIAIDQKTSEMRTLRMNQKGGSYQEYSFSGYKMK